MSAEAVPGSESKIPPGYVLVRPMSWDQASIKDWPVQEYSHVLIQSDVTVPDGGELVERHSGYYYRVNGIVYPVCAQGDSAEECIEGIL